MNFLIFIILFVKLAFAGSAVNLTSIGVTGLTTGDPGAWSGYHDYTCNWSGSNGTYAIQTGDAACGFGERVNNNFGTVASTTDGTGKTFGLNITPKNTGVYRVRARSMMYNDVSNAHSGFELRKNGSTVIGRINPYGTQYSFQDIGGLVKLTKNESTNIQLYTRDNNSGNTYTGNQTDSTNSDFVGVEWEIFPVTQNMPGVQGEGPRSEVQVHTRNGYGSTNTMIPRFTTTMRNTGSGITYADTAADGASFTINEPGLYSIYFQIHATSGASPNQAGITVNSNQLTTVVNSISYSRTNGVLMRVPFSSNASEGIAVAAWTGFLNAGDVIRPHTRGEASDQQSLWNFGIVKVAN